jgi:hypothetical protein
MDYYLHGDRKPKLKGGIKALQESSPTLRVTEFYGSTQSKATIRSFADYYEDDDNDGRGRVTGRDGCPPKPSIIRSEKDEE